MLEEVGQFQPTIRDALLLEPSTLPVGVGYSLSKSICDLRTSTRALIRVRRASLGPQGRVHPGVHGEAR